MNGIAVVGPTVQDATAMPHAARIAWLESIRRERARLDAIETRILAAVAADPAPYPGVPEAFDKEWAREEVACALRLPPVSAHARMMDALDLVTRLPDTVAAMAQGRFGLRHATRLIEAVRPLPSAAATTVERRVLPRAGQQTVTQFAASVRRAVLAVDPRRAEQRHADAVADRRVVFTPQNDGVTELWALLPADTAAALQARLDEHAARSAGDGRSADQRRADALIDLALGPGTATDGIAATVQVTMAFSTLTGADEQPGELAGHGPIPASLARRLAAHPASLWRMLPTDRYGNLLAAATPGYRPGAALARSVRARALTCCFPGCRRRSTTCEVDHLIAWAAGGRTTLANLHPLCLRHHHLKHDAGWTVHRDREGTTIWRSPTGCTYYRPPDAIPTDTTRLQPTGTDPPPY